MGAIVIVFAAGIFGLTNMESVLYSNDVVTQPQNQITTPEPPSDAITESVSYNFGSSIAENKIAGKSSLNLPKFVDIAKAKLGDRNLDLINIRVRDNGDLYSVYGPSTLKISDQTSVSEIYQSGALQIRVVTLKNPESTFDALANYFKDEVQFINSVPTLIDKYDDGYQLQMYPGDNQKIIIAAKVSLEELKEIVVLLGIENKGLDLKEYVVKNWEIPQEPSLSNEGITVEP